MTSALLTFASMAAAARSGRLGKRGFFSGRLCRGISYLCPGYFVGMTRRRKRGRCGVPGLRSLTRARFANSGDFWGVSEKKRHLRHWLGFGLENQGSGHDTTSGALVSLLFEKRHVWPPAANPRRSACRALAGVFK